MQILEMTLHAFGKFEKKTIRLAPGLNIVRGNNEAGKSTVHSFIEAMFYGFFKPYTKKKIYDEAYERFLPWDYSGYSGTLTLMDGEKKIRLERQFEKGKDALNIFEVDSGDDLTQSYDYNKVTRLHDVAMTHIGFNRVTYNNTISLTQMQTRTEEDLIREIKDNMSNLASSHQSTISVEQVLEGIEAKEKAIGSNRKKTSLYYKEQQRMIELEKELTRAKEIHKEIAGEKEKENRFIHDLEDKQQSEVTIRKKISYLTYLDNVALVDKAQRLEDEVKINEREASELAIYKDFDGQVVSQLQQDKEVIDKLEREIDQFHERKKNMVSDVEKLSSRKGSLTDLDQLNNAYEEVNRAVHNYDHEEAILKTKQQELILVTNQLEFNELPETFKSSRGMIVGLSVLMVFAVISVFYFGWMMLGFVAVVLVGILVVLFIDKQRRYDYSSDKLKVDKLRSQKASIEKNVQENEKRLIEILETTGLKDIYDLKLKRDQLLQEQSIVQVKVLENQELGGQILMLNQEIDGVDKTIDSISQRYKSLKEDYNSFLRKFHITEADHIQATYEKYLKYQGYGKDIDNLKLRIRELIGHSSLDHMKRQIQNTKVVHLNDEDNHSFLNKALDEVQQAQMKLTKEISHVQTRAIELAKSSRTIAEVEESIAETKGVIEAFDHDLKIASIMKNAVNAIAVDIQNNFAPVLNQELSNVVDQVSGGKYANIKVNPDMGLTIFDQSLNRTVKAESLSEGTIDMLYFGLRLGIAKILSQGKALPLILDDAFVQYDNTRLAGVMDLLVKQQRQVILFTCHDREVQYLDSLGADYNLIQL